MQIENSGVGRILRQLRWVLYPRRCPFCDRVLGSVSACPDCKEELETLRRRPTFRLARERHYIKNLEGAAAPYRYAGCVRRGGQSSRLPRGLLMSWAWRWRGFCSGAKSGCAASGRR